MKPSDHGPVDAKGLSGDGAQALLSTFCVGDFVRLAPILEGLVADLGGYTEEKLVKLVKDWCVEERHLEKLHQLVPPFLGQHTVSVGGEKRTLASFLAQPVAAEPETKRLKVGVDVALLSVADRASMMLQVLQHLPQSVDVTPIVDAAHNLGAEWPLCERDLAMTQIADAAENNLEQFQGKSTEKQNYQCVIVTGAAGMGKTRLCKDAMTMLEQRMRHSCSARLSVFVTFLNGEQISVMDAVDNLDINRQAAVALGLRVACKLFPVLGLCSAMPLDNFRIVLGHHVALFDLATVMRVAKMRVAVYQSDPQFRSDWLTKGSNDPIWITVTLDETHYAENPQDPRAPRLWPRIMSELMSYVIPGDQFKPQVQDGIVLFPILASTWSVERTRDHISPVNKVYPELLPLSKESVFEKLCIPAQLGSYYTPLVAKYLDDEGIRSFLLSCGTPRALARSIEILSGLAQFDVANAVKQICLFLGQFYKRDFIPLEVMEFALSGIAIPDALADMKIGGRTFEHWLTTGFASGDVLLPLSVPFPLLYNDAGSFIVGIDQFLNWGQPFYWQHFEALVPHIIRLRVLSLYRIRADHKASLREIFGGGSIQTVALKEVIEVVNCSEQWLVPKRGKAKNQQQLKVETGDTMIDAGTAGSLPFGALSYIFAAADGNVHFDGHANFQDDNGESVLVCYQAKHTRINPDTNVPHFTWKEIMDWLECARHFMAGYKASTKLFVVVTNKEVRGVHAVPPDLVLIHRGNLGDFFAPCLLSSAVLAKDE